MTEPIILSHLAQIFVKHYKVEPKPAAEEALRFLEILELYGLELIVGEWQMPEPAVPGAPIDPFKQVIIDLQKIERSGRTPWDSPELH